LKSTVYPWFKAIVDLATPVGVGFAGWQLLLTQRQSQTAFEDQLSSQYREILRRLPIDAVLGDELSDERICEELPNFLHYIDLCNEQAYLRKQKRVREGTWKEWEEGIRENLQRPAFARAWDIIARRAPESFDELRTVSPPKSLLSEIIRG
jgi:hypothetical protein